MDRFKLLACILLLAMVGCATEKSEIKKKSRQEGSQETPGEKLTESPATDSTEAGQDLPEPGNTADPSVETSFPTGSADASTGSVPLNAVPAEDSQSSEPLTGELPDDQPDAQFISNPIEENSFEILAGILQDYSVCLANWQVYQIGSEPIEPGIRALVCEQRNFHTGCQKPAGFESSEACNREISDEPKNTCSAEVSEYRIYKDGCRLVEYTGCSSGPGSFETQLACEQEYQKRVDCKSFSGYEVVNGTCQYLERIRSCEEGYSFHTKESCDEFVERIKAL